MARALPVAFAFIGALLAVAAVFSYINVKFLRLPRTTALMIMSLAVSVVLYVLARAHVPSAEALRGLVESIPFRQLLLDGLLGLLLFAGALHVDLDDLLTHKGPVAVFALLGTLGSTFAVGGMLFGLSGLLGLGLGLIDCLLFGALISPTDPIAVLGTLKRIGAPKSLEMQIAGESLFNDGVGVVIFLTLLKIAAGHEAGFAADRRGLRRRGASAASRWGWRWGTSPIACSAASTTTRSRCSSPSRWSPAATPWPARSARRGRWRWWRPGC